MQKDSGKRKKILDAMQSLMAEGLAQSASVSDIARHAGIGKGSIYYYFKSKEEILEAVIERSYSSAIEECKELISDNGMDAFRKMEIVFRACRESSSALSRQESRDFLEAQQSALIHQKFVRVLVKNIGPLLADIIRQGNEEGTVRCQEPDEIAELVVLVLAVKMDNHIIPSTPEGVRGFLVSFSNLLESGMGIERGRLDYLTR